MRFHFGLSFRPKQLIKWLIPILIGFGLLSVSDFVKADTRIDLIVPDVSSELICDKPLSEYITFFNNYIGDKYNLIVTYSNYYTEFVFVPNTYSDINFYSSVSGNNTYLTYFYNTSVNESKIDLMYLSTFTLSYSNNESKCNNVDFLDSPSASADFLDFIDNYHTSFDFSTINSTNLTGYTQVYSQNICSRIQISNNRDYIFNECLSDNNIIYSSNDIIYQDSNPPIDGYGEHYPTYINGSILNNGQIIEPTYYPPVELNSLNPKVGDLYLLTNKDVANNLIITMNFFPDDETFAQHNYPVLNGAYGLYGLGNNVYSFTEFNCNLGNYAYTSNNDGSLTLTINGLNCNNYPSNIYQFSTSISIISDDNKPYRVSNFSYNVSGGSSYDVYHYESDTSIIFGAVYLGYKQVPRDFKAFLSSSNLNSVQTSTIRCNTRWCYQVAYNINPFSETNPVYNDYSGNNDNNLLYGNFGLSINRGLLITNNVTMNQDTIDVDFFFPKDTKFYINMSGSEVCYFDGNTTQCTQVTIDFLNGSSSDDYDVDYYFSEVSDYIDSISSDMARFGQLIQSVYDSIPSSISTFFFVMFILGNVFILIKLIKR